MTTREKLELLFLHALPLDGSMWAGQKQLLPGSTYTPTLYPFGDSIEAWAAAALKVAKGDRLLSSAARLEGLARLNWQLPRRTGLPPSFSSGLRPGIGPTLRCMPQRWKRFRKRDWRKPGKSSGLHCFHVLPNAE
jgi:hypothetical protein